MELPLQSEFQRFFDQDFSDVRVRETPAVAELRADALTDGHDIFIAPMAAGSTRLLAHELTHIVQRRQGRLPAEDECRGMLLYDPALEAEAEATAIRFEGFLDGRPTAPAPARHASFRVITRVPAGWLRDGAVVQCGRIDLTRAAFDRLPPGRELWVRAATGYFRVAKADLQWIGPALSHRQFGMVQELHDSNPLMGHPPQREAPRLPPPLPPPLPMGPLQREIPLREHFIRNMDGDPAAQGIPQAERRLWDSAKKNLKGMGPGNPNTIFDAIVGNKTIDQFEDDQPEDRLALINRFWEAIVEWKTADKTLAEMFEPGSADAWSNQSSAHRAWAFRKYGIAFRCEKAADLERITNSGFSPLYLRPDLAEALNPPHHIRRTVMMTKTAAGQMAVWKKNRDGVGQTAICVSRGIKGATKFPEPGFVGDAVLFAVKVTGLRGFDLEEWQRGKVDKTAVWRPGEKMYPSIPRQNVIGYVPLTKSGLIEDSRWSILVHSNTWNFLGGNREEQDYLNGELADLAPMHNLEVSVREYDFWRA